jgi:uncharacterized RDD family membrane protein YckC
MLVGVNAILTRLGIHQRIRSAILDHLSMGLVLIVLGSPLFMYDIYKTIQNGHPDFEEQLWTTIYSCLLGSIYFNKDALLGQGIGKKICRLQVIDRKTKKAANPLKCLLRNITILIWPLELAVVLFKKNRRIGDLIANTEIASYEYDQISSGDRFSWLQVIASVLIGALFIFLLSKSPLL